MKTTTDNLVEERICIRCNKPLSDVAHGNSKAHKQCAMEYKKQYQRKNYQIGNSAKLLIQKNEKVLAHLYEIDTLKGGIPYILALEYGLKFNCPSILREQKGKKIYMFDRYGYSIETVDSEHLIFIYHESDLN